MIDVIGKLGIDPEKVILCVVRDNSKHMLKDKENDVGRMELNKMFTLYNKTFAEDILCRRLKVLKDRMEDNTYLIVYRT